MRAPQRIGYAAMAAAFAPMLGPTFGGALDQALGWRASFWLLGAVGIALFVWCAFDLVETHANRSSSLGQQLRAYPALLRARRFWAYALCMAFSTGAFYAFLAGAPLAASGVRHRAGGDRLLHGDHHGRLRVRQLPGRALRAPLRIGHDDSVRTGGRVRGPLIGLALRFGGATQAIAWFGPCVLVGIGNGLTNPGAHAGAVSVRPALAGSASGLAGAMTIAGGAALSSLTGRC